MLPAFFGVSYLQVVNATHAYFEFLNSPQHGAVIDQVWVSRTRAALEI